MVLGARAKRKRMVGEEAEAMRVLDDLDPESAQEDTILGVVLGFLSIGGRALPSAIF
jgi:hypothetical protein